MKSRRDTPVNINTEHPRLLFVIFLSVLCNKVVLCNLYLLILKAGVILSGN